MCENKYNSKQREGIRKIGEKGEEWGRESEREREIERERESEREREGKMGRCERQRKGGNGEWCI